MSLQVEKLKKKAAEFEAKRQTDKAIATYLEIFRIWDGGDDDDVEVPLYNRVGDMLIRMGNIGDAMTVWEKAVDYYGESGFHNNAIALCNKILRNSPGRTSVYYKLGKMSAQKGFKSEAKKNYLEYADRMQKANNIDEAFRALKEFADLCPDDNDIRQTLADQLSRLGRSDEALEQLQLLYERFESTGDSAAASATVTRMRAIDPAVEPKRTGSSGKRATSGLVFLDLDSPPQRTTTRKSTAVQPPKPPEPPRRSATKSAMDGLPLIDMGEPDPPAPPTAERRKSTAAAPPAPEPVVVEPLVLEPPIAEAPAATPPVLESLVAEPIVIEPTPLESLVVEPPVAEATPLESLIVEPVVTEPTLPEPSGTGAVDAAAVELEPLVLEPLVAEPPVEQQGGSTPIPLEPLVVEPMIMEPMVIETLAVEPPAGDSPAPKPRETFGTEISFGASFGTEEAGQSEHASDLGATAFEGELGGEGAVWSALSTPEDATFGTLGTEVFDTDLNIEPQSLELLPDADFGGAGATAAPDLPPAEPTDLSTPLAAAPLPEPAPRQTTRRSVRPTMSVLAQSVDLLRDRISRDVANWQLRREFGEALLEDGDREGGVDQLESAMVGFERDGDLESARSVAEEIIRLQPLSIRHHQKRVEFAFRTEDRPRLIEAYVDLADALFREGQADKSKVVYRRVLELAPDDVRALAALASFTEDAPPAAPRASRTSTPLASAASAPVVDPPADVPVEAFPDAPTETPAGQQTDPPFATPFVTPFETPFDTEFDAAFDKRLTPAAGAALAPPIDEASSVPGEVSGDGSGELAAAPQPESPDEVPIDAEPAAVEQAPEQPTAEAPVPPPVETLPAQPVQTTAAPGARASVPASARAAAPPPPARAKVVPDGEFVDLEDWLKEDEGPKSTRMVVDDAKQTGDENADFNDMLRKFKQGVAENVEEEDHESHYDLGIAYKEMGLVEEAIAEFQKALRGQQHRVRTYEALGQCFVEKGQEAVATTILQRALAEPGASDDQLIGVLYLLGMAAEVLNQQAEAVKYYRRVFAVDINFRDVQQRMRALEQGGR